MSIRSDYGAFTSSTGNDVDTIMNNARNNLSNILGGAEAQYSTTTGWEWLTGYDDSFAGMNENSTLFIYK